MEKIIIGTLGRDGFLGEDGRVYPVPVNYISKSKLLFGDTLKLIISEHGFQYKQIKLIARKNSLVKISEDSYKHYAITQTGESYEIPRATVSFYSLRSGDEAIAVLPLNKSDSQGMCAIEGAIKNQKL